MYASDGRTQHSHFRYFTPVQRHACPVCKIRLVIAREQNVPRMTSSHHVIEVLYVLPLIYPPILIGSVIPTSATCT